MDYNHQEIAPFIHMHKGVLTRQGFFSIQVSSNVQVHSKQRKYDGNHILQQIMMNENN